MYNKLMWTKGWMNQGVIKGARVNQDSLSVMVLFVKQYQRGFDYVFHEYLHMET